ncbi:hypothetical protein [Nostoc favosum]|uniref:Uncharacterized protein n=1 Tax=Nostoc favosum CHAB5714 TaxID=2780399 RepID=A0ABS8IKT2_9NOSO|nr:hypothetical protein [Nostoc favosum]MCC5604728.1 hypothetical protein [Nostoc favosum CHAB5714]
MSNKFRLVIGLIPFKITIIHIKALDITLLALKGLVIDNLWCVLALLLMASTARRK